MQEESGQRDMRNRSHHPETEGSNRANHQQRRTWTNTLFHKTKPTPKVAPGEATKGATDTRMERHPRTKNAGQSAQLKPIPCKKAEEEDHIANTKGTTLENNRMRSIVRDHVFNKDIQPGPSGLQHQTEKERETIRQNPNPAAATVPAALSERPPPEDDHVETIRPEAERPLTGLAHTSENIRHRICIEYAVNPMLKNHRLGMDFATITRCLAAIGEAHWLISNIHTVIVWRDTILLQRSNGLDDALMFRWRQRDNYMALKTMATLREKGCWTCKKIKVYDTQPLRTTGTAERRRNMTAIMHRHLAQLLRRFGATEEIKLPECPYVWQQPGVDDLQELTKAMTATLTLRGIPNVDWTPNQCWLTANQLPLLMRRADTSRSRTEHRSEWRTSNAPHGATFAAYTDGDSIPQRGQGLLWHFPTTPTTIE